MRMRPSSPELRPTWWDGLAAAIVELSGIIKPYLKENGIFISSGIIIDRLADVLNALEAENFKLVFVQQMGEWVGVVAQKRD